MALQESCKRYPNLETRFPENFSTSKENFSVENLSGESCFSILLYILSTIPSKQCKVTDRATKRIGAWELAAQKIFSLGRKFFGKSFRKKGK